MDSIPRKRSFLVAGLALAALVLAGAYAALLRPPALRVEGSGGPASASVDSSAAADFAAAAQRRCGSVDAARKVPCYEPLLLERLASRGVRPALEALLEIGRLDREVEREGHVYAHAIGIAAYTTPERVTDVFGQCTEAYQSGCHHGVIQAYFAGRRTIAAEDVNALCRPFRERGDTWLLFQCVHGLGHGLTMLHAHHLPRALGDCDLLADDWDRESCYGGAFMENIVHATAPHHEALQRPAADAHAVEEAHAPATGAGAPAGHGSAGGRPVTEAFAPLDPADPLYPCSVLDERYLRECYGMQTSAILHHNGGDIAAAARTCDGAPLGWRPACYQSLGRDISSYALQDHAESIRLCSLGSTTYQPWCYEGVVKNFVDLTARPDDGFAFCRAVPGEENRGKCYEAMGEQIAALASDPSEREALCRASQAEYVEACRYGARVQLVRPPGLPKPPGSQGA
ncbi:MAG: hypothetical protein ABR599_13065 [Gemmatimonadota bacterium]